MQVSEATGPPLAWGRPGGMKVSCKLSAMFLELLNRFLILPDGNPTSQAKKEMISVHKSSK